MKFNDKEKGVLYNILIFGEIQLLSFVIYLIMSAISGDFNWTVERLTSSLAGTFVQILKLVLLINGGVIFIYVAILLILLLKTN